jgi:hypothetical protein
MAVTLSVGVNFYDELFSLPFARAIMVHVESKMASSRCTKNHAVFDTPCGKYTMIFEEKIGRKKLARPAWLYHTGAFDTTPDALSQNTGG